ncbi:GIY-YIG nuclease family protein, partial [Hymenobacter guriensis]
IKIICPEHGLFEQVVASHLAGLGCNACSGRAKLDTKQFIAKARAVHGEKYDYSQAVYQNSAGKVKIICPEHGLFEQTARSHYEGRGCRVCGKAKYSLSRTHPVDRFIAKARVVHGEKFDYSQAVYGNTYSRIKIICPEHGLFEQVVASHLAGLGCNACSGRAKLDTKQFIAKARAVHGEKYDYSQAVYQNSAGKVKIICPEHGLFAQTANSHMQGVGCPACFTAGWSRSQFIRCCSRRSASLYILHCKGGGEDFFKVGITSHSVAHRYKGKGSIPYEYIVLMLYKSANAGEVWDLEKRLHREYKQFKYEPRIKFAGFTECFSSVIAMLGALPATTKVCALINPGP